MIKRIFLYGMLIGLFVGFDQFSKYMVETMLDYQVPVEIIPFIAFFRTYNDGVSFSMLSGFGPTGLVIISLLVLAVVLWIWSSVEKARLLAHFGFSLICAGAIGNLIDRTTLGIVVDFIQFHTANWSFAIFNVADIYISLGVGAIILDEFLAWKNSKVTPENN